MYSYPEIFEHGAASVETAAFLYIPRDDVGKSNMYFEIISDISFCSGISGSEIIPDFNYYCSFKYSKLKPLIIYHLIYKSNSSSILFTHHHMCRGWIRTPKILLD